MLSILLALGSLVASGAPQTEPKLERPNLLVLLLDDIGVDRVGAYGAHPDPGRTPNMDRLASVGLLFRHAYANPICSPTRATILTGRYSFRTGVGRILQADGTGTPLALAETTLPEALGDHANVALGKWHLGHDLTHPTRSGFDDFAGSLYNLAETVSDSAPPSPGYYAWEKIQDGAIEVSTKYATTDTADDTIAAMKALPEPWFIYTAFNAPHIPLHHPPADLHTYDLPPNATNAQAPIFVRAMIEALDAEIGRVLQNMPPNTFVFVLGDNGTKKAATDAPFDPTHAKGTPFEGGINVPLIVYGPGVVQGECRALVNTTDLFATLAELGGYPARAEDSVSFAPQLWNPSAPSGRKWAFAEKIGANNQNLAIRGERYKLIRRLSLDDGSTNDRLFDLKNDPFEQVDLLDSEPLSDGAAAAYTWLAASIPN